MSLIVNDKITIPILVLYIVIVIDIVICIDIAFVIVIPHVPDCEQNSYNVEKYFFSPPKIRTCHLWNKFGKFDSISVDFLEVKRKIICVLISKASITQPTFFLYLSYCSNAIYVPVSHCWQYWLITSTVSVERIALKWPSRVCSKVAFKKSITLVTVGQRNTEFWIKFGNFDM